VVYVGLKIEYCDAREAFKRTLHPYTAGLLASLPRLGVERERLRVIPGNAGGSYLIQKLEGAADIVGLRMPRNGPPFLTDAQVGLIRQWITDGARNN